LITEEGKKYAAPFKALKMKYLLLQEQDDKILYSDNLIPPDWLHNAYREQWLHLLRIDGNEDRGYATIITCEFFSGRSNLHYFRICSPVQMTEEEFFKECFRCGRLIKTSGEHIWRWKAFHYGLDLLMTIDMTGLRIERNHRLDSDYGQYIKANHKEHKVLMK